MNNRDKATWWFFLVLLILFGMVIYLFFQDEKIHDLRGKNRELKEEIYIVKVYDEKEIVQCITGEKILLKEKETVGHSSLEHHFDHSFLYHLVFFKEN